MFPNTPKSLNIRGLNENTLIQLQSLAMSNERSLEGEARYAIQQWCKLNPVGEISLDIKPSLEILERFKISLDNVSKLGKSTLTYSQLAEKLKISIRDMDAWLSGRIDIPFDSLDELSVFLGCDPQWLKHGIGNPYKFYFYDISKQSPLDFALDFLNTKLDGVRLSKLHIVFNEDTGYVYIIQEFDKENLCYVYLSSSFYLKGEYGSSELDNSARFVLFLLALDKIESNVIIKGYTIKNNVSEQFFTAAQCHPLLFRSYAKESLWNEDIIDENYPISYWDGYKELQFKIHQHIRNSELLKKYHKEINEYF